MSPLKNFGFYTEHDEIMGVGSPHFPKIAGGWDGNDAITGIQSTYESDHNQGITVWWWEKIKVCLLWGLPGGSDGKESACNARDPSSISGLGKSPGEQNGNPLQYSCLEKSIDRGVWWATVHGVTKELYTTR